MTACSFRITRWRVSFGPPRRWSTTASDPMLQRLRKPVDDIVLTSVLTAIQAHARKV